MKLETINRLETAEICGIRSKNGKMKVEHCARDDASLSASAVQHEAPQGRDGTDAHPHFADEGTRTPKMGKEGAVMSDDADETDGLRFAIGQAGHPSVEIDVAKYQAYLDDPSLSDAEKEEIIKALWSIMMTFVDLGFGLHPAQEVCGKLGSALDVQGDKDSNESKPVDTLSNKFERVSDDT